MESSQYSRSLYAPIVFLILLASLSFLAGCGDGGNTNVVLAEVNELASVSPRRAMEKLDSVDYSSLSGRDRHYYDLMSVKVRDKAYITHESDSLILDVIGYYESHKSGEIYPEALYYGGRVYSDLGDYPTALSYFQRALDEKCHNLDVRSKMLSQTSRLLNTLRLYDEAIPYLTEAIEINIARRDTLAIMYDYQLLGAIYIHKNKLDSATHCFKTAITLGKNLPPEHNAKSKMYMASVKYANNEYDSALFFIRNALDNIPLGVRNSALSRAASIYLGAGILDTAYRCAYELINRNDLLNRRNGYEILLSDEMRDKIPADTLNRYISEYRKTLEKHFDERKFHLATMQQSTYNYQLHERKRIKAEQAKDNLRNWIVAGCFLLLIMATVILYLRIRQKNTLLQLHIALNNVRSLKQRVETISNELEKNSDDTNYKLNLSITDTKDRDIQSLRKRLRTELLALYNDKEFDASVSSVILQSKAYHELQSLIAAGRVVGEDSAIWHQVEMIVEKSSPNFKRNIHLLTGGRLTHQELHTALLIKCGITPSQMMILFARSKGAISSRREELCFKVFDEKLGTKVIDGIIRLL